MGEFIDNILLLYYILSIVGTGEVVIREGERSFIDRIMIIPCTDGG